MLEQVDLKRALDEKTYNHELKACQLQLVRLQRKVRSLATPIIIMYEGWDASGKGGSILRITEKLDPRGFRVWPIGAPTPEELAHHYLWRFWVHLPERGQIAIFDRSWYGRVLVERVEKLAPPEAWKRAYHEIRAFERMLVDDGNVLIKFWMHISKDEQLRRFKERESDPYKQWKISPDDWRNREHWHDYEQAAEEMFAETHTTECPWHLIAANNKHAARVETAQIVIACMERAVERHKGK